MSFAPFQNEGGLLGRLYGGSTNPLGGLLGGSSNPGGLLSAAALQDAQRRSQMAMAAALLQASGPSPQKIGFGQALGGAMLAGQQAGDNANQQALQAELLKRQLQPKPVVVKDKVINPETGQIIYSGPGAGSDAFGTVTPDKFTPASLEKFRQTGNYSDLTPVGGANNIGNFNPGDYTPGSFARFMKTGDPVDLQRYVTPPNPTIVNLGGVETAVTPSRTGAGTKLEPLSTLEKEAAAKAALTGATEQAKSDVAQKAEAAKQSKQFEQTWKLYEAARGGLMRGLEGTQTDPLTGRLPAVTSAQQTAEGGVSAMAPVLKQLFRVAGEGVFTDRDQQLLLNMVPDRKDHPAARDAKIANIDAIIRAKLNMPSDYVTAPPNAPAKGEQPKRRRYNPATGKIE